MIGKFLSSSWSYQKFCHIPPPPKKRRYNDLHLENFLKLRNIFEVFLMSTRENLQIYKIKKSIKSDENSLNVFYFFVKIPRQIYQCLYFCVPPLMVGISHILLNFLSLYFSLSKGT